MNLIYKRTGSVLWEAFGFVLMSKMPWLNVPPLSLEEGLRAVELSNYACASTPEAYQYETKQELGLHGAATCMWWFVVGVTTHNRWGGQALLEEFVVVPLICHCLSDTCWAHRINPQIRINPQPPQLNCSSLRRDLEILLWQRVWKGIV